MALVGATVRFIKKYDQAFPLSVELGPPDVPPQLPVKPSSIPAVVARPFYGVGFFINNWYLRGHLNNIGCNDASMLPSHLGNEWKRRQSPEPFILPSIISCIPRDAFIYFVADFSPPQKVQRFLTHRVEILKLFCDMMKFSQQEQAFVLNNVKWYRHSHKDETLPPEICMNRASFDTNSMPAVKE